MMDPFITALLMTEAIHNMERETEKERYHMDPFIAGIAIHEAVQHSKKRDEKEKENMDPFTLYQNSIIRHEERLKAAASWQRGEPVPSLVWRMFAAAQRTFRAVLALRVSLTVYSAERRRSATEPDMCIE